MAILVADVAAIVLECSDQKEMYSDKPEIACCVACDGGVLVMSHWIVCDSFSD